MFSVDGDEGERVVALVQCRTSDPATRETLQHKVAAVIRTRHGLEVSVILTPPHSLPQTSSGKLSRTKAKNLYLSGTFEADAAKVVA